MELPNLFQKKSPTTDTKKFLAIELNRESVKTAVWEVNGIKPELITVGSIEDYQTDRTDDLIQAVDRSLSKALSDIDPEPDEVIFSLPESWVDNTSITKEKRFVLRELKDKLGLKIVGFVVSTEAIINYLQVKHGGPISSLLIAVSETEVQVTLVKHSRIEQSHLVGRSDDISSDVEEGIARFQDLETLPANMILYNGNTNLEQLRQELITYNWVERLPFIHLPKIDLLSPTESIEAVVIAGGPEVIKSLKIDQKSLKSEPESPSDDLDDIPDLDQPETDPETDTSTSPSSADEPDPDTPDSAAAFGFDTQLPDGDNFTKSSGLPKPPVDTSTDTLVITPDSDPKPLADTEPDDTDSDDPDQADQPSRFHSLLSKLPRLSRPSFRPTRFSLPVIAVAAIILILLAALSTLALTWYLPTATVTLTVEPTTQPSQLAFTIDTNLQSPDPSANAIPGILETITAEAQLQAAATGSKRVGERASGSITLYNRSDQSITVPSGTRINGPETLAYTIDQAVTVASASTKPGANKYEQVTTPSTAQVAVTAVDIGAQYNLGQGTELSVTSYSTQELVAEVASTISGGSSREVSAIAQSDLDDLEAQVIEQLEQQLSQQQSSSDTVIGSILLESDDNNLTLEYSGEAGDEATSVYVTGNLTSQALTYNLAHLKTLLEANYQDLTPPNYQLVPEAPLLIPNRVDTTNSGSYAIEANADLSFIPKIDATAITRQLAGKRIAVTEPFFHSIQGFDQVAIKVTPTWLGNLTKTFPQIPDRITFTLSYL